MLDPEAIDQSPREALPWRLGVPPLYDRIARVMRDDTLTCTTIIKRLEAQGWMPSSKKPQAYISVILSTSVPAVFSRVKRGQYRLSKSYSPGIGPRKDFVMKKNSSEKQSEPVVEADPLPIVPSTLPDNLPLVMTFDGSDSAWIIERSAALGKTPKEYMLSHIQVDMRKMISQLRVQSFRASNPKPASKIRSKK